MRITFLTCRVGLQSAVKLLPIFGIEGGITLGIVQGSQLGPLLSVVRSDCLRLPQISQRLVRGLVHRPDDGRLDMACIQDPRQMVVAENGGAVGDMSRIGRVIFRYDVDSAGMSLSCRAC